MLSDWELYELSECYELSKLNENTPIDEVLKTYGQLQLNAARMAALVKNAPELKRRAIEDWLKYGVLCEFWRDMIKSYDSSSPILLEGQMPQRRLANTDEQNFQKLDLQCFFLILEIMVMTQPGANDWKTPLGYYERAIAELRKAREEFQAELRAAKKLRD